MAEWIIERLATAHDRKSFSCGKAPLDQFLHNFASQYEKRDFARVYVAVTAGDPAVKGYYTLSSGSVVLDALPDEVRKKLPRHPVPVAHLGRLAVATDAQGQRLGETLLIDAFRRCCVLSDELGLHAVEVFSIDEGAKQFYLKYGFESLLDDPMHLYLTMKNIRALNLV